MPATVAAAARAGVTAVQLRDPAASDDELVALGRAVVVALRGTGVPLLVNDRVHLVDAIGADGAHIGQSDLDPGAAREVLGPRAYLGLSAQTLEHVAAARARGVGTLDYLGVGPVWPQVTKPDAAEPGGVERLREIAGGQPVAVRGDRRDRRRPRPGRARDRGRRGRRRQRHLRPAGRRRGRPVRCGPRGTGRPDGHPPGAPPPSAGGADHRRQRPLGRRRHPGGPEDVQRRSASTARPRSSR